MEPNPYLDALRRVAAGRTASFAELARLAGRPAAARAAGRAVAAVPTSDPRPWHRIVQSDGGLAPDPERAAVQVERLRAEGARPRAGEEPRAWARRRRARFVGSWRSRALYEADDERLAALDPLRLEVLRDEEQTLERGFYFAPPPPAAKPSPFDALRTTRRNASGIAKATKPTAAQRRAELLEPESPEELERILSEGSPRPRSPAKTRPKAKPKPSGRPRTPRGTRGRAP